MDRRAEAGVVAKGAEALEVDPAVERAPQRGERDVADALVDLIEAGQGLADVPQLGDRILDPIAGPLKVLKELVAAQPGRRRAILRRCTTTSHRPTSTVPGRTVQRGRL